jgi:hypothetical protein
MSSAQNKSHQSSKLASSSKPPADDQTNLASQPPSSAENAMDQPLDSALIAVPPAPPTPSEIMSSTDSSSTDSSSTDPTPTRPTESSTSDAVLTASEGEGEVSKAAALRQQPIPPASEPMQYRAIGLIRGRYVASEEQFTRGEIVTDDGVQIGAVLLGRVMSLVKKHLDLEQSHLWVVYPRTREKGDGNLHVQIVGVWEPENLNRDMDASESSLADDELSDDDDLDLVDEDLADDSADDDSADDALLDEDAEEAAASGAEPESTNLQAAAQVEAEPALTEVEAESDADSELAGTDSETEPIAATVPDAEVTADTDSPTSITADQDAGLAESTETVSESTSTETASPVEAASAPVGDPPSTTDESAAAASDLDDRYFSVRGEVIYQSIEEKRLLVKIRRVPRPGTDENKAFKVMLVGALEGKAVGYFWDLHVQREGNMLVVQEGTMIGAVPPQKRGKRPPFNQRRGGSGGGRRAPGGPGGPPRKRWQNRDGQQRPTRSGGSERPTPPQNRENRPPSPRPIKRRNLDNPEK